MFSKPSAEQVPAQTLGTGQSSTWPYVFVLYKIQCRIIWIDTNLGYHCNQIASGDLYQFSYCY